MLTYSKTRFLVEVALFSLLALFVDFFSFSLWPQGGSISLQMIPIFIIAFRWGLWGGLLTGFNVGILLIITGGYIIHPIQALLDYPLAFAVVGIAAIINHFLAQSSTKNMKYPAFYIIVGCIIGSVCRLILHIISAIVFFRNYVPNDQILWIYAFLYNGSYIFVSCLISIVVLLIIFYRFPSVFHYKIR